MATTVSFNGTNYSVPNNRDPKGWGTALTAYLVALGTALAKSGGNFTLTADVNFGANYGLIAVYYKSATANIATIGVFRLANNEGIAWRNAANSANLLLKVDASDDLVYDGNRILDTTDILDEDDLVSDSATAVPSQQSVKAYVDTGLSAKVNTTNPVLNGSVTGTGVLDEDNMASDSATKLATQQSIKAYVDTSIAAATSGGISYHAQSGSYTVLDGDGYRVIAVTTGASDATITLPTAADNTDRILTIFKTDSGAGTVIIDGEGAETVGGDATRVLYRIGEKIEIICDGSNWQVLRQDPNGEVLLSSGNGFGSTGTKIRKWTSNSVTGDAFTYTADATNGDYITVNRKCIASVLYGDRNSSGTTQIGVSLNADGTARTTNVVSLTDLSVKIVALEVGSGLRGAVATGNLVLNAGDILRAHGSGDANSTDSSSYFRVVECHEF